MSVSHLNPARHDWTRQETLDLLEQPFNDLLFQAQMVHIYIYMYISVSYTHLTLPTKRIV